ncbi:MAG: vWA domain-containing protein [Myxococcota bacterium]
MSNYQFANPQLFPWFLWIVVFTWLLWRKEQWREQFLSWWYRGAHEAMKLARQQRWRRGCQAITLLMCLTCLGLALTRPYLAQSTSSTFRIRADIAVLLDISPSMESPRKPFTLRERAMLLLHTLRKLPGSIRTALIVFSGEAGIQCPWTTDPIAFQELAWQSRARLFTPQGDGFSQALILAKQLFKRARPNAQKRLLVLSDGWSNLPQKPTTALPRNIIPILVSLSTPSKEQQRWKAQVSVQVVPPNVQHFASNIRRLLQQDRQHASTTQPQERAPFLLGTALICFLLYLGMSWLQPTTLS